MSAPSRRYPLEPLAAAVKVTLLPAGWSGSRRAHEWADRTDAGHAALAAMFDVDRRTIERWAAVGVPEPRCDELAVTIARRHPRTIWADWDDDQAEPDDGFSPLDDVCLDGPCRSKAA